MDKAEMISALKAELEDFKKSLPTYLTPDEANKRFSELESKMEDLDMKSELTELKNAVEKHGLELQKMNKMEDQLKTLAQILASKKEEIERIGKNRSGKFSFEISHKAALTPAAITDNTLAMRLGGIGQLPFPAAVLESVFARGVLGPGNGGVIRYVDQKSVTNAADWVACAAAKPESTLDWQEYTAPLGKIAHWIAVCEEMLYDFGWLESEIRNFLITYLNQKIDNDLYDGSGVAPIIKGIETYAPALAVTAQGVTDANLADLIFFTAQTIRSATQFQPNVALVNPADFGKLAMFKGTAGCCGSAFMQMAPDGNSAVVNGIRVVQSASVTVNTMVVGDFRYATVYDTGSTMVEVGWKDDDFIKNIVTIRAERRLMLLVRNAHLAAFAKITDVGAAITTLGT